MLSPILYKNPPQPRMTSPCSFATLPVSWVAPELGPLLGDEAALALAAGPRTRETEVSVVCLFGAGAWRWGEVAGEAAGKCAELFGD